ncbi:MAG: NAD+ synthase [Burkholderiaceae bacterium]|nr:NAD+ synthase [Burkholderiaceae bacterium]
MSVVLAQGNFRVGHLQANAERIAAFHQLATKIGADLIVFPELALCGYPPQDLLFDRDFLARHDELLAQCAQLTQNGCTMLIGALKRDGDALYNSAFLFAEGQMLAVQDKRELPNSGVFDEKRYFRPGTAARPMNLHGVRLGVLLCEDAWTPQAAHEFAEAGADVLLCLNASPFETGKREERESICKMRALENDLPLLYLNLVGAQDDLVFDGSSFVMNGDGEVAARFAPLREDPQPVHLTRDNGRWSMPPGTPAEAMDEDELIYQTLVLALREFAGRNGYKGAVLGLSGGIDSALCAALAVDAFGAEQVETLFLPSPFTSQESREDAFACATRLGIACEEVSIEPGMHAFARMMGAMPKVVLEENQTRLRASLLLARARRSGRLLINTGNKSEMATGYTTMYGDLCGHYAPLKDVYKTLVYRLAVWRINKGAPIPERILHKPPSAELAPGQRDDDVLPPYPVLDAILEQLLEQNLTIAEIAACGHERTTVQEVQRLLDAAQHKRHQAPPGPKITRKALANERRYPISNGWYVERSVAGKSN